MSRHPASRPRLGALHGPRLAILLAAAAAALALPAAAAGPQAPKPARHSADPEQELRAIREALLDKALAGRTRVSATSWVNEKGELLEASQFRSDLDIRGVRVVEYLGQQPEVKVETTEAVEPHPLQGQCAPSRRQAHLRHPVRLRVQLEADQPQQWNGPALQARIAVEQSLQAHAQAAGARFAQQPAPASEPRSAYERAVFSREQPRQPLDLTVGLRVVDGQSAADARTPGWRRWVRENAEWAWSQVAGAYPEVRPAVLRVEFTLTRPNEPAVRLYREDLPLTVADADRPLRLLSAPTVRFVQSQAERWWLVMADALACEPITFEVRQQSDQAFRVMAGADAGLRPGDRLVLTDSRRIPRRLLEADAAQHLALLEVERVEGDRAQARQVAGPAVGRDGVWVALPY